MESQASCFVVFGVIKLRVQLMMMMMMKMMVLMMVSDLGLTCSRKDLPF